MTESWFTQVYGENWGKVKSGIQRVVRDPAVADELAQETFLRFLEFAEKRPVDSAPALLYRISHNLAIDHVRRTRRHEEVVLEAALRQNTVQGEEAEFSAIRSAMVQKLRDEDEVLLQFFTMKLDFGLTTEEIATELKISRRSAFRLRDKVKAVLGEFL